MIITRLVLENYGLFGDRNEFDLRPRTRYGKVRPIVLLGGKNGSGKTTFLDAIRLALYGRQAVGSRVTQRDYHEILTNRIHRPKTSVTGPRFARVGVGFEFVTGGEKNEFYVERSWLRSHSPSVEEFFRIEKDQEILDEVSAEHWESFIADVVPERLSQLFFFDGEKIKSIAEDITGNDAICRSIHSLLGLDLVERLKADLSIYATRIAKRENPVGFGKELASIEDQLSATNGRITEIDGVELPAQRTEQRGLQNDVARHETLLKEQGATFANKRDENLGKRSEFENIILGIERRIRHECDATLPFVLCPTVGRQLVEELEYEITQRKGSVLLREIEILRESIDSSLDSADDKALKGARDSIAALLDSCFGEVRERFAPEPNRPLLHYLSDMDSGQTIQTVTSRAHASALAAIEAIRELEKTSHKLHETKRRLKDTPDEEVLKPTFAVLAETHQRLGAINHRIAQLGEERAMLENKRTAYQRQKDRFVERVNATTAAGEKLSVVTKILPALDKYRERLTMLKISSLEIAVTECFNRLAS